jgi:hypothetical protein
MVYDMMIQNASSQDREWVLLFGAGVKDPTVFSHFMTNVRKYGASIDVSEVMSHFEHKGHCALMLIDTWVWQHYKGSDRKLWQPETLGQARYVRRDFPRFDLPWYTNCNQ